MATYLGSDVGEISRGISANYIQGSIASLSSNTLFSYTNTTSSTQYITGAILPLGSGNGEFDAGTYASGDGGSFSFYVNCGSVNSSSVTVTNAVNSTGSTGSRQTDFSALQNYTVTMNSRITVNAGSTVNIQFYNAVSAMSSSRVLCFDNHPGSEIPGIYDQINVYVELSTFTVTYDANGGSGAPAAGTKESGEAYTISTVTPTGASISVVCDANGGIFSSGNGSYTKTLNMVFESWNTAADGSGTTYEPGSSYTQDADITLYAQYSYPTLGSVDTPSMDGGIFQGWYSGISASSTEVTSNTTITENTTIYAHWNYYIYYDTNGGDEEWPEPDIKEYSVTLYLRDAYPERLGYDFHGWGLTSTATTSTYTAGSPYMDNASVTLYAIWETGKCTVTFVDGYSGAILKTEVVDYGGSATPPADPTRKGYKFRGWLGSYTNVTGDCTVTAMWGFVPIYIRTEDNIWVKLY